MPDTKKWTGADAGRAIRSSGARLRREGKLHFSTQNLDSDQALWTLAKLLTGTGQVTDADCRQCETWLDRQSLAA